MFPPPVNQRFCVNFALTGISAANTVIETVLENLRDLEARLIHFSCQRASGDAAALPDLQSKGISAACRALPCQMS